VSIAPTTKNSDATGEELWAPQINMPLPGPIAREWLARDERVVSPSYTRAYPLVAARGQGCVIEDVDGNCFLDFTAGIAVTATGHCHPQVTSAIAEQAGKLIHFSGTDFHYASQIELAERLERLAPGGWAKRVFFANSGAEAVEAAIKMCRFRTGRPRLIGFYGSFHGRTYGAMSLGASKAVHRRHFGPLVSGIHHVEYDCDRSQIERLFSTVAPPDEVAAIVVEPILGEGGYRIPSPKFLHMLREMCDRHGILLVADEVQTGMGRTGRMFAVEHFGVEPDVICLAKGIASGMPLGAVVARREVMNWPPGSHASTFGGNPISCRAALATIDLLESEYLANAQRRGEQLLSGLEALATATPFLARPRGLGLLVAIDAVDGEKPDAERRDALIDAAFQRGLLLLGCGQTGIRFCPALCVTAPQVDTALDILGEVCRRG